MSVYSPAFCNLILITTCEVDVTIPLNKLELKSVTFKKKKQQYDLWKEGQMLNYRMQ